MVDPRTTPAGRLQHEIRTPASVIKFTAEEVLSSTKEPETKEAMELIIQKVDEQNSACTELIDELFPS